MRRKGNLIIALMFSGVVVIIALSQLKLSTSWFYSSKESAEAYSSIQNYRAAAEIACYQYVLDLSAITISKDSSSDWVSNDVVYEGSAMYDYAIELIQQEMALSAEEPLRWKATSIAGIVSACGVSDGHVLLPLVSDISDPGIRSELNLSLAEPLRLDWGNSQSHIGRDGGVIALAPFTVNVNLSIRGEAVSVSLAITGMQLYVSIVDSGGGELYTMMILPGEEGIKIVRA